MKDDIVITGIGFMTPCKDSIDEIISSLENRRSAVRKLEDCDYSTMPVDHGGRIELSSLKKYNFDPIKLKGFQNYIKFGLAATKNALSDAGFIGADGSRDYRGYEEDRRGAFVSTGINGRNAEALFEAFSNSKNAEGALDLKKFGMEGIPCVHPKWILTAISNNLIFFITSEYSLKGDNNNCTYTAAGGCYMLDAAISSIRSGHSDMAVVTGSDSILNWQALDDLSKLGLIGVEKGRRPESMQAYTAAAAGSLPSEGAACLVIEKYENAVKRGAKIYCRISSILQYSTGADIFAAPDDGAGTRRVLSAMLSNLSGETLVNLNGSAVPAWDADDIKAVSSIAASPEFSDISKKLHFTSSKPYFGHAFSASFVIDSAVSALSLLKGFKFAMPHNVYAPGVDFINEHGPSAHVNIITMCRCLGGNTGGVLFEKI